MIKIKKVFIIIVLLIIVAVLISIIAPTITRKQNQTNEIDNVLSNYKCKLQKISKSKEKNYEKDIYASIKYKPIEKNDSAYSNKYYYDQLIGELSKLIKSNYRIIDNAQEIIIRVQNGKKYTINDEEDYFEKELEKIQKEKTQNSKASVANTTSEILKKIISTQWRADALNLENAKHKKDDNQDIYYFDGYEVRISGTKVYNITFNKQYQDEVFSGIRTGLFNSQIKGALGEPLYNNMDAEIIIGYKLQDYYAFFYDGTISLYSTENQNSEELLEYEARKDLKQFFVNTNN